jgi:glutamate synthase domain-containing protein 1
MYLLQLGDGAVGRPGRLAMTDGRWVCGGLDRNALRPMRYVVTATTC